MAYRPDLPPDLPLYLPPGKFTGFHRQSACPVPTHSAGTLAGVPISKQVLADDEEVLVDLHPHWAYWLGPAVVTVVAVAVAITIIVKYPGAHVFVAWVLAAMVAVPALWLVGRLIRWYTTSLVVTTMRILYVRGITSRDLVQIRLQRVTEVHCTQTLFERLVGAGRLVVDIEGEDPVLLDDVRRPKVVQRVISRQLDELTVGGRLAGVVPGSPPATLPPAPRRPPSTHRPTTRPPRPTAPRSTGPTRSLAAPAAGAPGRPYDAADYPFDEVARGPQPTVHEQLIQLDDLRRRGIITEDEFTAKKAELLHRL